MEKKKLISQIFKILLLYEDAQLIETNVTDEDYNKYLDRLYIYWVGDGCSEIYNILKGLRNLGTQVEHNTIKSLVFHMINIIEKGA